MIILCGVNLTQRMDIISSEIDKSLQEKARQLELKAAEYCECLNALDVTESRLQAIVPGMVSFDLVQIKS